VAKPKNIRFNRDRAARILVDAITLGDKTAADRHQVSEKTIQRYRERAKGDAELSALVRSHGREAEHGWHFARARFLRKTLAKLEAMVDAATREDFEHVIDALKAAGELDLATEALGVGSGDHRQDPAAPADQSGTTGPTEGDA
jgi:hypothetical protein